MLKGSISFIFGPRLVALLHFSYFHLIVLLILSYSQVFAFLPLRSYILHIFFFFSLYLSQIFTFLYPYIFAHADILPSMNAHRNFSRRGQQYK